MTTTAKKGSKAPRPSKYRALVSGNVDSHDDIKAYEFKEGGEVVPCACHASQMLRQGVIEEIKAEPK